MYLHLVAIAHCSVFNSLQDGITLNLIYLYLHALFSVILMILLKKEIIDKCDKSEVITVISYV